MDYKKYKSRSRHPKTLIRGYRLFLMDFSDEDIASEGISASEIAKIKKFHIEMLQGKVYSKIGQSLGIGNTVSKNMFTMFHAWKEGKPLSYKPSGRKEHPRVIQCFSLLIEGATDEELREKCTEFEIQKAHEFLKYADADMLSSSIAIAVGIPKSTVKCLLKIYKEKGNVAKQTAFSMAREGMNV